MKFRIKHKTTLFYYGIIAPWIIAAATLIIFIALGFTIEDVTPTYVLFAIVTLCIAAELIFALLHIIEGFFGAKITVESDRIKVKMLLRRKNISFDDIENVKYRHCYDVEEDQTPLFQTRFSPAEHHGRVRSKLIFYLSSGKKLILTDDARSYQKKQRHWTAYPDRDPDEDIKLYQAYKCYCAAARHNYNQS